MRKRLRSFIIILVVASCGVHRFFDDGHDLHADASILTFLSGMFFHFKVKCK